MIVFGGGAFSAPRITLYECNYLSSGYVSDDGSINNNIWKGIKMDTRFYEYWLPEPGTAAFKTGLRMLYSDKGIYLNITFFEDLPDQVKATRTKRGDNELWTDDCVEIYFDPINSGTGYSVFTANLLGTRDSAKVDENTGLRDSTWSPENWQANVKRIADGYEMLVFIGWDAFQSWPQDGDIWSFNLVRYRYATGKFQGSTWAPGGNYGSPYMFGNILFGGGLSQEVETIAMALAPVKGDSWEFISDSGIVTYYSYQQLLLEKADTLGDRINNLEWRFEELKYNDELLTRLKQRLSPLNSRILKNKVVDLASYESFAKELNDITSQLENLACKVEIDFLFTNKTK